MDIKKLSFLWGLFILLLIIAKISLSDRVEVPKMVKVNDISMYESVANRIIKNSEESDVLILSKIANADDSELTEFIGCSIHNALMEKIEEVYHQVIKQKTGEKRHIFCEILEFEGKEIVLYINTKDKFIHTIIIQKI